MSDQPEAATETDTDGLIDGGKVMSLWDHLGELRTRVIRAGAVVIAAFFLAFTFSDEIYKFLAAPAYNTFPDFKLTFIGVYEVFIVKIKVSMLVAVVASAPVWLFQFWKFFEPALYPRERRYILPFVFASTALFFLGTLFCYLVILPIALEFFIKMGVEAGFNAMITASSYYSTLVVLIFGFGLVFETPVLLVLLALLDLISAKGLREYRRFVLVGILVVGAMITPPDPLSQILMAVPVYLMYEISIIVIQVLQRPREKSAENETPGDLVGKKS